MKINWQLKKFEELSSIELYKLLHLRAAVFVVEQNCPYQDADGKDLKSFHVLGTDENGELQAYSRIVPPGISFDEVSIGRVVTAAVARGKGAGKELMRESLKRVNELYGTVDVRIGAQCYLLKFYTELGFVAEGEEFLEDNIPHIEMVYSGKK